MSEAAPFLLVHGAMHGAWCWDRLVAGLARRGRRAVAIDLPGGGDDPLDPADVTFADYVDRVVAAARDIGQQAVLVGHSMGGLAITAAAERAPELFSALVYVTAIIPADQETMATIMADALAQRTPVATSADGRTVTPASGGVAAEIFYHDCPPDLVAAALPRLRPMPVEVLTARFDLSSGRAWGLPRHYVECTDDVVMPIAFQRRMIAAHLPMAVHTLRSAHSPFMSMPEELADVLASIA